MTDEEEDICRVCRTAAAPDRPLFHPCICTGSIKHIHQDCLTQWLRHSKKEYCELCNHKYSFRPIYSPDMPPRLPIRELFSGLTRSICSALKCWIHYTLVAVAWLGIVPLTACRIFNCIFSANFRSLASFPMDILSTKNVLKDILNGFVIVGCCLITLVGLIWLRIQLVNGEMPDWVNLRAVDNVEDVEEEDELNEDEDVNVDDNNNEENLNPPLGEQNPVELPNNGNWNGFNWERGGDEPTWERILGLDGSLMFLEHVFWVMALNTLFILLFAFCPYHLGQMLVIAVGVQEKVSATKVGGLVMALFGYVLVAFGCLLAHTFFKATRFAYTTRLCALSFIVLRVCVRLVAEIGLLPLLSGFWLDVCSLKLFNATLTERKENYLEAPGYSLSLHWLTGLVFIFYVVYFLLLLKEVLRPGTVWFLDHLFNPNYNPVRAMIHESTQSHTYKFIITSVLFGTTITVVTWLPVRFLNTMFPGVLPYNKGTQFAPPFGDFPLQIIASQLILPIVLEQGFWRDYLLVGIKSWCRAVGDMLGIRQYLLHEEGIADILNRLNPNISLQMRYTKPRFFILRCCVLLSLLTVSLVFIFSSVIGLPVVLGRLLFKLIFGPSGPLPLLQHRDQPVHELYTFAIGLWTMYSAVRLSSVASRYTPFGFPAIRKILRQCGIVLAKSLLVAVFVVAIIPLQLGLLFDLTMVIPLRVPLNQTPVIFLWQNWALGMLLQKLLLIGIFIGPNNWLRRDIEQALEQGFLRLNIREFLEKTVLVVVKFLSVCLTAPYIAGHLTTLVFSTSLQTKYILHWRIYPCLILGTAFVMFCWYELKQFRRLCDHIKNERYLIGKRLIDYDPQRAD